MNKIAIVFWSGTGNTEAMAGYIAEGVRSAGGEVELMGPGDFSADRFSGYSAVAFGCPAKGSKENRLFICKGWFSFETVLRITAGTQSLMLDPSAFAPWPP